MLNKVFSVSGVLHEYGAIGNELFFLKKVGGVEKYNLQSRERVWDYGDEKLYGLIVCGAEVILDDLAGNLYILNKEKGAPIVILNNRGLSSTKCVGNESIVVHEKRDCRLYSLASKSEIWRLDSKINLIKTATFNGMIFSLLYPSKSSIICIDKTNGRPHWSREIRGELITFVGVAGELLWISIIENKIHQLIALNIKDGMPILDKIVAIKYSYGAKQIAEKNTLLCIHGFSRYEPETEYKEIDGLTGEVIRTGVVQSLLEQKLVLKDWEKFGEHIYFTAVREEKFPAHIGVLDYKTLELLHWQKVELEEGCYLPAGKAPVVSDNKLYILDTGGTLHIYQIN